MHEHPPYTDDLPDRDPVDEAEGILSELRRMLADEEHWTALATEAAVDRATRTLNEKRTHLAEARRSMLQLGKRAMEANDRRQVETILEEAETCAKRVKAAATAEKDAAAALAELTKTPTAHPEKTQ